jgi:hypothetical protein
MNTLSFQLTLKSLRLNLPTLKSWLGKEVEITITELPKQIEKPARKWNFLGSVTLESNLDNTNIRDLAYD